MITRLKVNGFKNLIDVDVRFGTFTCIAGPNGAGKSNLFDAIRFLSFLADKSLLDAAQSVRSEKEKKGDIKTLFYHFGDYSADTMSFETEMIIPHEGIDEYGQKATATTTFVRYTLEIKYCEDTSLPAPGTLQILKEVLEPIKLKDASETLQFENNITWRKSVLGGSRGVSFISTSGEGEERKIQLHQDAGIKGNAKRFPAKSMHRTILSTVTGIESPTVLLARREMQSWMLLQLEPGSLREPDRFITPPGLQSDGSRLPATLFYLARDYQNKYITKDKNLSSIYDQVADRLSELIDDIYEIDIDEDKTHDLLTLRIKDKNGSIHPARSLSDGTLRFLALTVLSLEPKAYGLICMEEPENGIHPQRITAMLRLLQDIAVDTDLSVGYDNPFRQIIIVTHSPSVVKLVPDNSLLIAELKETIKAGKRIKGVQFSFPSHTWRAKADPGIQPVSKGKLLYYLNPVQRKRDSEEDENPSEKNRRIIDREDFQSYIQSDFTNFVSDNE